MRHGLRQQKAERAAQRAEKKRSRSFAVISGLAAFSFAALLAYSGYLLFAHPATPLPRAWNPLQPLVVSDPVTPITGWKLDRTASDPMACAVALGDAARFDPAPAKQDSDQCFIADPVSLSALGEARIDPLETRCATALRMAMWTEHSVQPAAGARFGQSVARIGQIGSYNCRRMRTSAGTSTRMSTHATADAVDITGFTLSDGTRIRLLADWDGADQTAAFLRDVRDGACDWFGLTLSPDFNRLHVDHFHLQNSGWGGCR